GYGVRRQWAHRSAGQHDHAAALRGEVQRAGDDVGSSGPAPAARRRQDPDWKLQLDDALLRVGGTLVRRISPDARGLKPAPFRTRVLSARVRTAAASRSRRL